MLQSQNFSQVMVCNASWTGAPCHHHVLPPQNNHYVGSGRIEKVGLCFILKALCHFGWKKAKTALNNALQCLWRLTPSQVGLMRTPRLYPLQLYFHLSNFSFVYKTSNSGQISQFCDTGDVGCEEVNQEIRCLCAGTA